MRGRSSKLLGRSACQCKATKKKEITENIDYASVALAKLIVVSQRIVICVLKVNLKTWNQPCFIGPKRIIVKA